MASKIKVFVVDSQPLFCMGLQTVLQTADDIQWLGSAVNFDEYGARHGNVAPDLLLVGAIPEGFCFETISAWKQQNPNIQILAMLSHPSEVCLREAISHGVLGCILKTDDPGRFIQAVRAVAGGEQWFSRQLLQQTVQTQILATPESAAMYLTEQEKEMLQLLCAEKSNAEIATALHLSERTVCRYLEDVYVKLGVHSRVGAAFQATKRGLA